MVSERQLRLYYREEENIETRPNSWAKQVREIEWRHWTLDLTTF